MTDFPKFKKPTLYNYVPIQTSDKATLSKAEMSEEKKLEQPINFVDTSTFEHIRVFASEREVAWFYEMQLEARTRDLRVTSFPVYEGDLELELKIVPKEVLEKEEKERDKLLEEL